MTNAFTIQIDLEDEMAEKFREELYDLVDRYSSPGVQDYCDAAALVITDNLVILGEDEDGCVYLYTTFDDTFDALDYAAYATELLNEAD